MDILSHAQRRSWLIDQSGTLSGLNNVPLYACIRGPVDIAALDAALGDMVERHDVLRTVFEHVGEEVRARALSVTAGNHLLEVRHTSADNADRVCEELARRPFDLSTDIPVRVTLFVLGEQDHRLLVVFHHIAVDAWSVKVLLREFGEAYRLRRSGTQPHFDDLPIRYPDYREWHAEVLGDHGEAPSIAGQELAYWLDRLDGLPDYLDLNADRAYDDGARHTAGALSVEIGADTHVRLAALAMETRSSMSMVGLAALASCLSCSGAGTDIPIGTLHATRNEEKIDRPAGCFLNTVVLRLDLGGDPTFAQVLDRARNATYEALHSAVSFDLVVEALGASRRDTRNPLCGVMLTWGVETGDRATLQLAGAEVQMVPVPLELAKVDLAVDVVERRIGGRPDGIDVTLTYDESMFDRVSIKSLGSRLSFLLHQVASDPALPLSQIDLLDEEERTRVVVEWNDTDHPLPWPDLPSAFRAQLARTPDSVAVETDTEVVTYAELDERANRLAHLLIERGAGPERCVAVILPRAEALVAMLAVLKARATFLPIDPTYPQDRIVYILQDAQPEMVVTLGSVATNLGLNDEVLLVDQPGARAALLSMPADEPASDGRSEPWDLDSPAYVVYTSGSTGRPKGVVVTGRVLLNLLSWQVSEMDCRPHARISQFSAISFDAFEEEILAALLSGQTVVVPSEETRKDPAELLEWLGSRGLNEFLAPDTVLRWVLDEAVDQRARLPSLQRLLQGGEPLQLTRQVRSFCASHPDVEVWNHYGPSETHVVTALHLPRDQDQWPAVAPIGRPIWNCQTYVLDARLRSVPIGVPGELYIAGAQLARGYLRRPGLTAERFVANPFGRPGGRMYRTGDIVRWNRAGELEFVGRVDDQIKIGGIRIDLNEINSVLRAQEHVANAATSVREDQPGQRRLVAYIVPVEGQRPDPTELRQCVAAWLPSAAVPSAFVLLDELPMNSNGKLDRQALPVPSPDATGAAAGRPPASDLERALCAVFSDVLGTPVGVGDDFFEVGGQSLLAVRLVRKIREDVGLAVTIRSLFANPTVEALARTVAPEEGNTPAFAVVERPARPPLSSAQYRLWFIDQLDGPNNRYNLTLLNVRLAGPLTVDALRAAYMDVLGRHESLRTVFPDVDGHPYQHVLPASELGLTFQHLVTDEDGLADAVTALSSATFDLAGGAPVRAALLEIGPEHHAFVLVVHHIVADAWSVAPLIRDLRAAYAARRAGRAPDLPPPAVHYADFSVWQRAQLNVRDSSTPFGRQELAWRDMLQGAPVVLDLPTDRPRPAVLSARGDTVDFFLDDLLYARIRSLARAEGVTPFMVLQAGLAALLTREGAGTDLPLGTTVAGRSVGEMDDVVGCFVNTLVLRTDTSGEPPFTELLRRIREADLEAFGNQDLPFERVVEVIRPPRSPAHHALFQVMITMAPAGQEPLTLPDLDVTPLPAPLSSTSMFDLTVAFTEDFRSDGLRGLVEFSADLFDRSTADRLGRELVTLLGTFTADPATKVRSGS